MGAFVFGNMTNQPMLTDFDKVRYGHFTNGQDLGLRIFWTGGERPRANVVDFQVLQHHDGDTTNHGAQYDEEGWRLTGGSLTTFGTRERRYPQSTAMLNNVVNGLIRFRRANGAAFDMIQIKLVELNGPTKSPVNFVGFPKSGDQVDFNVVLDGIGPQNGMQTFNFPGSFRNLDRVEWRQVSPFHQFDDIVARLPVIGACCLPDERCEDGLSERACTDKGGFAWRRGERCDEFECPTCIIYSEKFVQGQNSPDQCAAWKKFQEQLVDLK